MIFKIITVSSLAAAQASGDGPSFGACTQNPCSNVPGTQCVETNQNDQGFFCPCRDGFQLDLESGNCRAENICEREDLCTKVPHTVCVATAHDPKGYFCPCKPGYHVDPFGNCLPKTEALQPDICADISLCADVPGTFCVATTNNSQGYFCTCKENFELDMASGECREQNICEKNDFCQELPNTVCVPTDHNDRGYFCPCKEGYEVDPDTGNCVSEKVEIDICAENPNFCSDVPNTVCVASDHDSRGYFCPCAKGYEIDYLTGLCRLILINIPDQEKEALSDYEMVAIVGETTPTTEAIQLEVATKQPNRAEYYSTPRTIAGGTSTTFAAVLLLINLIL